MKVRLKKDIVIKAGTVFETAPVKTERIGDGHVAHIFGLSKDTSGEISYCIESDDPDLQDWFEVLE